MIFDHLRELLSGGESFEDTDLERFNLSHEDRLTNSNIGVRRDLEVYPSEILVTEAETIIDDNSNSDYAVLPARPSNYKVDIKSGLNDLKPYPSEEITQLPEGFQRFEDSIPVTTLVDLEGDFLELEHMDLIGKISEVELDSEGLEWYRGPDFPAYAVYNHIFDIEEFDEGDLDAMVSREVVPESVRVYDPENDEMIVEYTIQTNEESIRVPSLDISFDYIYEGNKQILLPE